MTTTEYYWTNPAASRFEGAAQPKNDRRAVNWRLVLAVGLNIAAWAAILKTL